MRDLQPISETLAEGVAEEIYKIVDSTATYHLRATVKDLLLKRLAMPEAGQGKNLDLIVSSYMKTISSLEHQLENANAQLAAKPPYPSKEVYIYPPIGDHQEGDEIFMNGKWTRAQQADHFKSESPVYRRKVTLPLWPEPIKFSERMPEEGQSIFIFDERYKEWKVWKKYDSGIKFQDWFTHWLPQPPAPIQPKTEGEEETRAAILGRTWDQVPAIEEWKPAEPEKDDLVERIVAVRKKYLGSDTEFGRSDTYLGTVFWFLEELARRVK